MLEVVEAKLRQMHGGLGLHLLGRPLALKH